MHCFRRFSLKQAYTSWLSCFNWKLHASHVFSLVLTWTLYTVICHSCEHCNTSHVTFMYWSCEYCIQVMCLSCGIHVNTIYKSCDFHVLFIWTLHISHVTFMCCSCEHCIQVMSFIWYSCEHCTKVMCYSCDPSGTPCESHLRVSDASASSVEGTSSGRLSTCDWCAKVFAVVFILCWEDFIIMFLRCGQDLLGFLDVTLLASISDSFLLMFTASKLSWPTSPATSSTSQRVDIKAW